jgi:hypothetical protein
MLERIRLGARRLRRARHWTMELLVVAVGVLLALWAQAWFEHRRDAEVHRETIAEMDALLGRVLAQTAARVAAEACTRARIAELDAALRASAGQWLAMPLRNLPQGLQAGHFPVVYLVDTDVLPLSIFDTARQNGTMATLAPVDRQFYLQVERQLTWLNGVWNGSGDPSARLALLGIDGPLGEQARDDMRLVLASLDTENRVTILRARALARLARERGVVLSAGDLASYGAKLERDRRLFGDCVVEVEPLALTPVNGAAGEAARPY